jgi:hypothetical protein
MTLESPVLSVIVVVYDMPTQAMNTLYSLAGCYQQGVDVEEYEVVVVENASAHCLDPDAVGNLGPNFRYLLREESGVSPAPAINAARGLCRGRHIGLLIDGARMLTPRVLEFALQGLALPGAVVAVPGYYLSAAGMGEGDPAAIVAGEQALLAACNWREQGYELFRQAAFSNGNHRGYLNQMMECNALFCSAALFDDIGGADERFDLKGGGSLNLHLYRQLATAPGTRLVVLPGEGNFHQFHGGTSTTAGAERDALVETFNAQLNSFWPGGFRGVTREPWLLGAISEQALDFLQASAENATQRFTRMRRNGADAWADETALGIRHGER